jgi:hypothetical protein
MNLFPVLEQDKEREIIQKAEEEFLEIAKALKEEGSAAVRQKRPSLVTLNRIAFENRKREQTVDNSKFATRTQALKQEKADLLARTDFQKRRVAVAKDRKIFFTLSNTSNTAMADADMEFHESQLGLAKAKRRIAEIDNELKNIELLDFKHHKVDGVKREPTNTEELKIVAVDGEEVKPTDQSNVENGRAKLLRGNVLSQIKVSSTSTNYNNSASFPPHWMITLTMLVNVIRTTNIIETISEVHVADWTIIYL